MEDRKKQRETMKKWFPGDFGVYLAKLDELMSTSKGRYLVDKINGTFEIAILEKRLHLCFNEGRVKEGIYRG